jgi:UDP-N-acetylmuramyl pentapeptide phosphotransferase/UDP-N-acetylglucosamine-1-phosphate transferase
MGASMAAVVAAVLAFLISALLTRRICNPASRLHVLDHPNDRSLHTRATPRTGGVAILAGVLAGFVLLALWTETRNFPLWLVLGAAIMAALSFADDRRGLSVRVRLLGHLTSAGIVVASGLVQPFISLPGVMWEWPAWLGTIFSLLFLIWMANLYNFMDGMDGFAGGMAVIGFGTFGVLGGMSGNGLFMALSLVIAAGAGGFLLFNFPPARLFMGDVGSSVLGLLAAAFSLWGARDGVFPFWIAVLVFSPFVVDATVTLIRRILQGDKVWEAHKTHYYQRLVQLGWGHKKTVLREYVLMLACGLSAIWAVQQPALSQWLALAFWSACYIALAMSVRVLEKRVRSRASKPC